MNRKALLVEIRCEELPPAQVWAIANDFPDALLAALVKAGFADADSCRVAHGDRPACLATPRRFAALLDCVLTHSSDMPVFRRGPAVEACHDDEGAPTPALIGFMRSVGATCENTLTRTEEKGKPYVAWQATRPGVALQEQLAPIVEKVLRAINAPRLMRWGDNDFKFIRPIRGLLMMHGDTPLSSACPVFGVSATPATVGHPVLTDGDITLPNALAYSQTLRDSGRVIVDMNERQAGILEQFAPAIPTDEQLLAEVTAMCEYPTVYSGNFDEAFLSLPSFCIGECMGKHQRAFLIEDKTAPTRYWFVADNQPPNPETMINGFNAVSRARLSDVAFYIAEDKKLSLEDALDKLNNITYHRKLGSQRARVERLQTVAVGIADKLGFAAEKITMLKNTAQICKSDLSTLMINEYPSLEGRMAATYWGADEATRAIVTCHNSREWKEIIKPLKEQHQQIACILLMANHLEKLVAIFGIGEEPSGSKDPHGLRIAATAVAEVQPFLHPNPFGNTGYTVSLTELIKIGQGAFNSLPITDTEPLRQFIIKRIYSRLIAEGISNDVLNAVSETSPDYIVDFEKKAQAVSDFKQTPEGAALVEINKRINNILRKSDTGDATEHLPDEELLIEKAEQVLSDTLKLRSFSSADTYDYPAKLQALTKLKPVIDTFFDEVLVNAEDDKIRRNRFSLLALLRERFGVVCDLSKLSP